LVRDCQGITEERGKGGEREGRRHEALMWLETLWLKVLNKKKIINYKAILSGS